MKTVFQTITMTAKLLSVPVLLLSLIACGKKDENNSNQQVAAVQYQIVNGQCVNSHSPTTPVQMTYCNSAVGTAQYSRNGQNCVQTSTGQPVDPTYCSNLGYGQGQGYGQGYGQGQGYGGGYGAGYNQGYNGGTSNGWQTTQYGQTYPYGQGYAAYFGANSYPSNYGGGSYSGTENCVGNYYSYNGFTGQLRYCDGYSCRGLFLYAQSTRARVLCN